MSNWQLASGILGIGLLTFVALAAYYRDNYRWAREGWDRAARHNESLKFQEVETRKQTHGLTQKANDALVALQLAKDEKARVVSLYDSQTNRMHTTIQQREELCKMCNTQEAELDRLRRHVDLTDASVARLQILLKQRLSKDKLALLRDLRKRKPAKGKRLAQYD